MTDQLKLIFRKQERNRNFTVKLIDFPIRFQVFLKLPIDCITVDSIFFFINSFSNSTFEFSLVEEKFFGYFFFWNFSFICRTFVKRFVKRGDSTSISHLSENWCIDVNKKKEIFVQFKICNRNGIHQINLIFMIFCKKNSKLNQQRVTLKNSLC